MMATARDVLPADADAATLVGRLWVGGGLAGPRLVRCDEHGVLSDLSALAPTMADLLDLPDPVAAVRAHPGDTLRMLEDALADGALLAPCDVQAIKAAGVTFAESLIERVIEERARGDAAAAAGLRTDLEAAIGGDLAGIRPGSPAAEELREMLVARGLWSQYLEVGIGPDAEIFTKAQPMSAVGCGAAIGIRPDSRWNNAEPEVVLACDAAGRVKGAALGNDVNLRDFEGRSALLLSKAKDNNASCAIGPFIRLFDERFGIDEVRSAEVGVEITGRDGFATAGVNRMSRISRDPLDLVAATAGAHHQYPDGFMLFLGTMFVPTADRGEPGAGFTHHEGDVVRITSPRLGALVNTVTTTDRAPSWTFGVRALMLSLAARNLISRPTSGATA